jgi:hypothetical protein
MKVFFSVGLSRRPNVFKSWLPDGIFQTKNSDLGKIYSALEWTMLVHFIVFWNILRLYIVWPFGM